MEGMKCKSTMHPSMLDCCMSPIRAVADILQFRHEWGPYADLE